MSDRTRKQDIVEKRINTRKHKQEMENIKLDLIEAQDDINNLYNNLKKVTELLEETTNFTKGKLKYDSQTIVKLLKELYQFPISDEG